MKKHLCLFGLISLVFIFGCNKQASDTSSDSLFKAEIGVFPAAVKYNLDLDLDYDKEKVFADCKLTVRNPSDTPMDILPLILYRLMDVDSVTDEEGNPLEFSQRVLKYEDWEQLQVNHIRITLDPSLLPGETKTVRLSYGGHLLGCTEAMRYVKDNVSKEYTMLRTDSNVYPRIGVNSWERNRKAGLGSFDYTLSITVPDSLIAASPGKLMSKTPADGMITYTYQNLVSAWRMDLAVADFEILEDTENKLKFFVLPEDHEGAVNLMAAMNNAMDLYREWFGPLKEFEGLTVIEVPEGYGSQAAKEAIIQQASGFRNQGNFYEFYHELAHLWQVESRDPMPARFVSEGLAMFLQHFVQEKLEGKEGAPAEAVKVSLQRMEKYFADHPDTAEVPMIDYGNKQLTDLSYRMGQILFYLLFDGMGETVFLKTAGDFYQDFYETGATARQFVDYFRDKSDLDLGRIFEEWVFSPKAAEILSSGITLDDLLARYR